LSVTRDGGAGRLSMVYPSVGRVCAPRRRAASRRGGGEKRAPCVPHRRSFGVRDERFKNRIIKLYYDKTEIIYLFFDFYFYN